MEYLPLADHLIHIEDGFVQDMKNDDIAATTNQLMSDLKGRVDALLANRKKGPHQ
jgi:hypothetical protein